MILRLITISFLCAASVLLFSLEAFCTDITLKEDADLVNNDGKLLIRAKSGDKFTFDHIEGDWVYGSYTHESGITRGKISASAFKEQSFLKLKISSFEKEMQSKGLVNYEGKWIPTEEKEKLENEAKGLVKFEDKWMKPEERDKILAQRETDKKAEEEAAKKAEEERKAAEEQNNDKKTDGFVPEEAITADETKKDQTDVSEQFDEVEKTETKDSTADNSTETKKEAVDESEEQAKKIIDFSKSGKKSSSPDEDEEGSLSSKAFGKYFLPGMIVLAVIMILIVVLTAKRGTKG